MVVLTTTNYKVCHKNVKSQLLSCGSKIWRVLCEGCYNEPIANEVLWQDEQGRCIIYKKIHDVDLKRLVGLKHAKDMWDKIESIFGDGTRRNKENEKMRNKKKSKNNNKNKGLKKQEAQPQESHSSSAHDLVDDEKR